MTVDFGALGAQQQAAASYVGFFGRCPDPEGFGFWQSEIQQGLAEGRGATAVLGDVAESFRLSAEAQQRFPFLAPERAGEATQAEVEGFVTDFYLNTFNRLPGAEGLEHWTGVIMARLDQGVNIGDIPIDIIAGAQDGATTTPLGGSETVVNDAATVRNKIDVGVTYAQRYTPSTWTLADDRESAVRVMNAVDDTAESVEFGVTLIDDAVAADGVDRASFESTRISETPEGAPGNNDSTAPTVSDDGQVFAFQSLADNLVGGDTNGQSDIFVAPVRGDGTVERVNLGPGGVEANGESAAPSLSADGRFVVFESTADNLVAGDTNGARDIFLADRDTGALELISRPAPGQVAGPGVTPSADGFSFNPSVSADGRFVSYRSSAENIVAGDDNGATDIFLHDRMTGETMLASRTPDGTSANSFAFEPDLSADGRYVVFESNASDMVPGEAPDDRDADIFVFDREAGAVQRVSSAPDGAQGDANALRPAISPNGQYISFESRATNLVPGTTGDSRDTFVHDMTDGSMQRIAWSDFGFSAPGPERSQFFQAQVANSGEVFVHARAAQDFEDIDRGDGLPIQDGERVILGHDPESGETEFVGIGTGMGTNIGQADDEEVVPHEIDDDAGDNPFAQAFAAIGGARLVGIEFTGADTGREGSDLGMRVELSEAASEPIEVELAISEERELDPETIDEGPYANLERFDEFTFSIEDMDEATTSNVRNLDSHTSAVEGSQNVTVTFPAGVTEVDLNVDVEEEYNIQSTEFLANNPNLLFNTNVKDTKPKEDFLVNIENVTGPAVEDPSKSELSGIGVDEEDDPVGLILGGLTTNLPLDEIDVVIIPYMSEELVDFDYAISGTAVPLRNVDGNVAEADVEILNIGPTRLEPLTRQAEVADFVPFNSFYDDEKTIRVEVKNVVNAEIGDRSELQIVGTPSGEADINFIFDD